MTGRGVWGIWESQTGISGVTINQISKKWYKFHMGVKLNKSQVLYIRIKIYSVPLYHGGGRGVKCFFYFFCQVFFHTSFFLTILFLYASRK